MIDLHAADYILQNQKRTEENMCYNCGCEMTDNDMGDPKNITDKTFEDSAKAMDQTVEEAKRNTLALLRKELEENQGKS